MPFNPVTRAAAWVRLTGIAVATACASSRRVAPPLSDQDRAAIRANDSAYVADWLKDDTSGVLSHFTDDAVLIPGGLRPLSGLAAARAFWFPSDGSHTKLAMFTRSLDEIEGDAEVAYVRGSDSLRFSYARNGTIQEQAMRSVTLAVVRRRPDGTWRISRMMWATVAH